MTIKLYINKAEKNRLDKSHYIELSNTVTGTLREVTSLTDPVIRIETSSDGVTVAQLSNINYIYIEEFRRYYYVNEIKSIRNNMWELSCHVDVLMSYKYQLSNLDVILDRSSSDFNKETYDNQVAKFNANKRYKYWVFPACKPVGSGETPLIDWTESYTLAFAGHMVQSS